MKNLYLDIDGVLLTKKNPTQAEDAIQLIEFITSNFNCFWLTTHCKGKSVTALKYLSNYFDEETIQKLIQIKPTNWASLKTEAIDFNNDFVWLEDNPFQSEIAVLKQNNCLNNLIVVDLNQSNELFRVIDLLKIKL